MQIFLQIEIVADEENFLAPISGLESAVSRLGKHQDDTSCVTEYPTTMPLVNVRTRSVLRLSPQSVNFISMKETLGIVDEHLKAVAVL